MYCAEYSSPIGKMLLAADEQNLTGLWIEGQKYYAYSLAKDFAYNPNLVILRKTKDWLDAYFLGKKPQIKDLSLAPSGNEFRQTVWRLLCDIPYGQTVSYEEIAQRTAHCLGKEKMSAQAVGTAIGHNPITLIIPCHRVVAKNGALGGYAAGVSVKSKLLQWERIDYGADCS